MFDGFINVRLLFNLDIFYVLPLEYLGSYPHPTLFRNRSGVTAIIFFFHLITNVDDSTLSGRTHVTIFLCIIGDLNLGLPSTWPSTPLRRP